MTKVIFIFLAGIILPLIAVAQGNPPAANLNLNSGEQAPQNNNTNTSGQNIDRTLTTNKNSKNNEPAEANVNSEVSNTNRRANIEKLREPAKLLPLTMIPLAIILYLIYRRMSQDK